MYRVEKFTPKKCPHCNHEFKQQNQDWIMFMGTVGEDGEKIPDPLWPRIICGACNGPPIKQKMIKAYSLGSEEEADKLVNSCGFFNKQVVEATGIMTQDCIIDYSKGESKLEVIRCRTPETPHG